MTLKELAVVPKLSRLAAPPGVDCSGAGERSGVPAAARDVDDLNRAQVAVGV